MQTLISPLCDTTTHSLRIPAFPVVADRAVPLNLPLQENLTIGFTPPSHPHPTRPHPTPPPAPTKQPPRCRPRRQRSRPPNSAEYHPPPPSALSRHLIRDQLTGSQATVEDLDLAPALSITPATAIASARATAYERDYSQLTVVHGTTRALLGYVSAAQLATGDDAAPVRSVMNRFDRRREKGYKIITPATPLEELLAFFDRGEDFAVVTDPGRRFVLGVATRLDLMEFLKRRPE